ncbi:hypothetical protein M405DRAFT_130379 [Rhizopogon salebrosus TDB-379]|nr:hypothetical protein M405DRAFT_130379 [Rhizopogon salebrosus TDB-379]
MTPKYHVIYDAGASSTRATIVSYWPRKCIGNISSIILTSGGSRTPMVQAALKAAVDK